MDVNERREVIRNLKRDATEREERSSRALAQGAGGDLLASAAMEWRHSTDLEYVLLVRAIESLDDELRALRNPRGY